MTTHLLTLKDSNARVARPDARLPQALQRLVLQDIHTLVFAGGGNRCFWQAGLVTRLLEAGWRLPVQLVGTSAGAGVAASLIAGKVAQGIEVCRELYASNPRIVDWSGAWRGRLGFAHEHIFPAWVASYLNEATFDAVRQARSRLRVAFARPHPVLGLQVSTLVGMLAYMVDKHINHSIHPRLPQILGLRQGYMNLHDCATLSEAQNLVSAAAAAPPFMRTRYVAGQAAIDGGFVDNAPVGSVPPDVASTGQSRLSQISQPGVLVLLTRFYPKLPTLFSWQSRCYLQPSRKIPVSTWDCTPKTTIDQAYDLGTHDADALLTRCEV